MIKGIRTVYFIFRYIHKKKLCQLNNFFQILNKLLLSFLDLMKLVYVVQGISKEKISAVG